jgi:hypothetical protein
METNNTSHVNDNFRCESCDFKCRKKGDMNRHLLTIKHKKMYNVTNGDIFLHKNINKCDVCFKIYKSRNGLWCHKKKCIKPVIKSIYNKEDTSAALSATALSATATTDPNSLTLMVVELMKSNQDLQKQMLELCKNNNSTINNTNNSHNNNKTFNMQFFLNEQCKDAMNIMDFVNTFHFDFSDLERVGQVGYVEGMSNIIIQKLNELDIHKRPIHCSDVKRDTMYVKDKNVWEKENGNHDKLRLAIRYIGKKNTDLLNKWCEAHPGSCDSDNYLNDIYMEMVMQAMGGRGDREDNENKIMRKIAKTVLIDKDM